MTDLMKLRKGKLNLEIRKNTYYTISICQERWQKSQYLNSSETKLDKPLTYSGNSITHHLEKGWEAHTRALGQSWGRDIAIPIKNRF